LRDEGTLSGAIARLPWGFLLSGLCQRQEPEPGEGGDMSGIVENVN